MPKIRVDQLADSLEELGNPKGRALQREPIRPREKFHIENFDWTEKQKEFIKIALNKESKILFAKGPAGCSKTLLSVYCALHLLNEGKVSEIVYVRSAVESSDSRMGFLPGDADQKLHFYNLPFLHKLEELVCPNVIKKLQKDESRFRLNMWEMVEQMSKDEVNKKLGSNLKDSYKKHVTKFMVDMIKLVRKMK